jgi:succinate-semialdehyde dehydrogenase / glutarate-semialdehyde dehydrogenase
MLRRLLDPSTVRRVAFTRRPLAAAVSTRSDPQPSLGGRPLGTLITSDNERARASSALAAARAMSSSTSSPSPPSDACAALAARIGVADASLLRDEGFIADAWTRAELGDGGGATFDVVNPATGETLVSVAKLGAAETRAAIDAAAAALPSWSATTAIVRAQALRRWGDLVNAHASDLARIMCAEQGKPLAEARGEVAYASSFIDWFADEGRRTYGEVIPTHDANARVFALRQPVGVCAAITPWNFPLAMITRKAAAALAAGCVVVVKPSEETPLSALALAELAARAGIPRGVLGFVMGDANAIGEAMTGSEIVRKLSFTGSTAVGKKLMRDCAGTVKRTSMELGGCAPFLVFQDANIDEAVKGAMGSKFRNAGQTCVSSQRYIVHEDVIDEFGAKFAAAARKLVVGDGLRGKTDQGPLINARALAKVEAHVADALSKGAKVLCGGHRVTENGCDKGVFYAPTVLANVPRDASLFREEVFGPVAALTSFADERDAIALANDTTAGLAAYVYTNDNARVWRVSEKLEYGMVGANTGVVSAASAPFGGVKESGMGREGGKHGIEEYLEVKHLSVGGVGR